MVERVRACMRACLCMRRRVPKHTTQGNRVARRCPSSTPSPVLSSSPLDPCALHVPSYTRAHARLTHTHTHLPACHAPAPVAPPPPPRRPHLDPRDLCERVVQACKLAQHLARQLRALPRLGGAVHEAVVLREEGTGGVRGGGEGGVGGGRADVHACTETGGAVCTMLLSCEREKAGGGGGPEVAPAGQMHVH